MRKAKVYKDIWNYIPLWVALTMDETMHSHHYCDNWQEAMDMANAWMRRKI